MGDPHRVPEHARLLESLGFDYLAWGEHIFIKPGLRPSSPALPFLAVAAGATQRLRLLTSITLLPIYHPILLAKEVTALDIASNGRFTLGVGVGGEYPEELQVMGVDPKDRGRRANEILQVMKRLWTEPQVSHQGAFFQFEEMVLNPRPVQQPHPPIWVAGRKAPAMRRAARWGDGWYPYFYTPEMYRDSVQKIDEMASEQGRDLREFQWACMVHGCLADSREEAISIAAEALGGRYSSRSRWHELAEKYTVAGTPRDCIERLTQYIEAGVRHLIFSWVGPREHRERDLDTLAREVLPHLR